MRKNQSSLTALGIAALRAVESEKPPGERICDDPYARRFVPGWFFHLIRFAVHSGWAERRGRGVVGFLVARERCIDDYLSARLREGIDQLVILGAGFDSRAYRFAELLGRARVFEVDHPASQKAKLQAVECIFGKPPQHVTYVSVDFNKQSLDEVLPEHGYDSGAKTVFIWQGVTYYLDARAVDATLGYITRDSGQGSSVIFDCIDTDLLAHSAGRGEVRGMRSYRGLTGEDMRFGLPLDNLDSYLRQRGFTQPSVVPSLALKERYFHGGNRARSVADGYAVVSAKVFHPSDRPIG